MGLKGEIMIDYMEARKREIELMRLTYGEWSGKPIVIKGNPPSIDKLVKKLEVGEKDGWQKPWKRLSP